MDPPAKQPGARRVRAKGPNGPGQRKKGRSKAAKARPTFNTLRLFRRSFIVQTKEFFDNSTLHGVRYIAEEGRPFFERFMWFCFVAFGFIAAVVIIFSLWEKFQTNPTITGLDTDFHNQQVIFPTVLVCPTAPYDEEAVRRVAYETLGGYEPGSEVYEPFLKLLTQLSYANLREVAAMLSDLPARKTLRTFNLRDLVFRVAVRCNDTFAMCRYKDEDIDCCEMFKPMYTEHGFCFAFNARYTNNKQVELFNTEFFVLFETDKKWALTFEPLRESNIFIHSYNEISGWDFQPQVMWDLDSKVEFLISMKQTYTTEDAQQLSIGQRKCIFPEEEKLQYYQDAYTFSGCMKECRISKSLKFCSCIPPFYAPVRPQPACTSDNFQCLSEYADNITSIYSCQGCELGCLNTVYDIEKYSKIMKTEEDQQDAQVTIEYLTWPIIRYKREVLFGWVDLLVSFGGIAGLFLGFSLLSGVELVYFFTMRAFCMLYKNRDELEAAEKEQQIKSMSRHELGLKPLGTPSTQQQQQQQVQYSSNEPASTDKQEVFVKLITNDYKAGNYLNVDPAYPGLNRNRLNQLRAQNPTKRNLFQLGHGNNDSNSKYMLKKPTQSEGGYIYDGYLP
ncbi:sodium channel protein Nach [Anopheles ziemanni]|uniref:sodium channel protein Nach n=1 Tax=Anopheles coustani TaxID=139045 RepID=UPI00265B65E6|nr:sodium channel protein Nach [Anopheles coustani]XP_058175689.1 sodium channel protein Nach [Anopheles ziemanni]